MEVTKQTAENECGICVINSLVRHFHKQDLKLEIFDAADISDRGISLTEFEKISQRFGINAESYEMTLDEFMNRFNGKYCVMITNNHYLIVRRKFFMFEIYDSINGKSQISLEEFKKIFSGIIVQIEKSTLTPIEKTFTKKTNEWISIKAFALILILQTLIMSFSILMARYVSFLLEWSIIPKNTPNGLIISFLFLLFGVISLLMMLLKSILGSEICKSKSINLFELVTEKLQRKQKSFFNKIKSQEIYSLEPMVMGCIHYLVFEIPEMISNFLFCIVSAIILGFINRYLLICAIIVIFAIALITVVERKYKSNFLSKGLTLHNNAYDTYSGFKQFLSPKKVRSFNENFFMSSSLAKRANNLASSMSFLTGLVELIFSIGISYLCCYQVNNESTPFSDFIYATSVNTIFIHCCISISHFFIKQNEFHIFRETLEKIINTGNIESKGSIPLKKISRVDYNSLQIKNGCRIDDKNFLNDFSQKTKIGSLKINGIDLENYNDKALRSMISFEDPGSNNSIDLEEVKLMPKLFFESIQKFQINLTASEEMNHDDKLLVNYLFLLNKKNKIILIKKHCNFSDSNYQKYFKKTILKEIKNKNFICWC